MSKTVYIKFRHDDSTDRQSTSLNLDREIVGFLDYLVEHGVYSSRSHATEEIIRTWKEDKEPRIKESVTAIESLRQHLGY